MRARHALAQILLWVMAASPCLSASTKRAIKYSDIITSHRALLSQQGISASNFDAYVQSLHHRTAARETAGENDHLIYYILQSTRFTSKPKLEPALSAREFVENLSATEKQKYLNDKLYFPPIEKLPATASARFNDFIKALNKPSTDERLAYFKTFIKTNKASSRGLFDYLYEQYARSMKFLYEKEFLSRELSGRQSIAAYVAPLYQERGHSTDTQVEANFVVYLALATLKAQAPTKQLNNVLIVGPGLDFAPRTDLIELFNPQSYQPFAVADALIGLGLADRERLQVHCVDINNRVVAHLKGLTKSGPRQLSILSGITDNERHPLSADYRDYFEKLGRSIGTEEKLQNLPPKYARHLSKRLTIRHEVVSRISADRLDAVTERYDPSPNYDLIVITNVLPYFNSTELLLALSNIAFMMKEGGYLVHNEPRSTLFSLTKELSLPMIFSRTALLAGTANNAPLHDGVWVHQRRIK